MKFNPVRLIYIYIVCRALFSQLIAVTAIDGASGCVCTRNIEVVRGVGKHNIAIWDERAVLFGSAMDNASIAACKGS